MYETNDKIRLYLAINIKQKPVMAQLQIIIV